LPDAASHHLAPIPAAAALVVSESGVIQSVDAKTGVVRWKRQIADQFVADPAVNGTRVIVATAAKQLLAISLSTGAVTSIRQTRFRTTAVIETGQRELIVGDERGNITSFSQGATVAWKFKSGGEISRMLAFGPHILVTSHDNFIYLLAGKSGSVEWKKRLTGRIGHIGELEGRYALISGIEEHGAVLTDLTNGKVAGQLAFEVSESLADEPIMFNDRIYVLTGVALYAYSLNGCTPTMAKAAP
jgi:outer membrane protein assembly factor BamB